MLYPKVYNVYNIAKEFKHSTKLALGVGSDLMGKKSLCLHKSVCQA